ncbi:transcriptional regulator ATRX-like isoform X3 [Homalodisca vitripennis]|nr:transcriptional regulator ATRX-like isoform X3 [Homalodisca vitripennis]XP_046662053.1 transcriptional regulator ATRX-like isoform X3 [Homalodisca vitripennis]
MERRYSQLPEMTSTPRPCRNTMSLEAAFREVSPIFPIRKLKSMIPNIKSKSTEPGLKLSDEYVTKQVDKLSNNCQAPVENVNQSLLNAGVQDQPNASKKSVTFVEAPVLMASPTPILPAQADQLTAAENMLKLRRKSTLSLKRRTSVLPDILEMSYNGDNENKSDDRPSNAMILKNPENSVGTPAWQIPSQSTKTSLKRKFNNCKSEKENPLSSNTQKECAENLFEDMDDLSPLESAYPMKKRKTCVLKEKNQKDTDQVKNYSEDKDSIPEQSDISRKSKNKLPNVADNRTYVMVNLDTEDDTPKTKTINHTPKDIESSLRKTRNSNKKDEKKTKLLHSDDNVTPNKDVEIITEEDIQMTSKYKKRKSKVTFVSTKAKDMIEVPKVEDPIDSKTEDSVKNIVKKSKIKTNKSNNVNCIEMSSKELKKSNLVQPSVETVPNVPISKISSGDNQDVISHSVKRGKNNTSQSNIVKSTKSTKENVDSKVNLKKKVVAASSSKRKVKTNNNISLANEDIIQRDESHLLELDTKKSTKTVRAPKKKAKNMCDEEKLKLTNAPVLSEESLQTNVRSSRLREKEKIIKESSFVVNNMVENSEKGIKQSATSVRKSRNCSRIKSSSEAQVMTSSNSQTDNEQCPVTIENPDLIKNSRKTLNLKRNNKVDKCGEKANFSNDFTKHKEEKCTTNLETDDMTRKVEKEVDEKINGDCMHKKDKQSVRKSSAKKRAVSTRPSQGHPEYNTASTEQPFRNINQNVREKSEIISAEDEVNIDNQVIGRVSARKSKSTNKISLDYPNPIVLGRKRKSENNNTHSDVPDKRHMPRMITTPVAYWENRNLLNTIEKRQELNNIKKSMKKDSVRNGGEDKGRCTESPVVERISLFASNKECHFVSPEDLKHVFYVQQCFGLKSVKVSEHSPGVLLRVQVHINNYMMSGTMSLLSGASMTKASTNTTYTVTEGAARVNLSNITKTVRQEDEINSFFIPKNSKFSILNEESTTLVMAFTKFKG